MLTPLACYMSCAWAAVNATYSDDVFQEQPLLDRSFYGLCDTLKHWPIGFRLASLSPACSRYCRSPGSGRSERLPYLQLRAGRFGFCNRGLRVSLQFAVKRSVRDTVRVQFLPLYNLIYQRMLCASPGGMGQHRDNRFTPTRVLKLFALVSAIGTQLFSGRI